MRAANMGSGDGDRALVIARRLPRVLSFQRSAYVRRSPGLVRAFSESRRDAATRKGPCFVSRFANPDLAERGSASGALVSGCGLPGPGHGFRRRAASSLVIWPGDAAGAPLPFHGCVALWAPPSSNTPALRLACTRGIWWAAGWGCRGTIRPIVQARAAVL